MKIGNTYRCACRVCACYSRVDTRGILCDLCMWGQHAEPAVIPREDTCTRCGAAPVAVDLRDAAHALGRPREALCRSCYLSSYGQSLALTWHTSPEHGGLQGTAFPETATGPEQDALL